MMDHHDVGSLPGVHHHHHSELPEMDHEHDLGHGGTVHNGENLVEAPAFNLDAKDHISGLNYTYQHPHLLSPQMHSPKKSKGEPAKKRVRTPNNNNNNNSGNNNGNNNNILNHNNNLGLVNSINHVMSPDDAKKRGRPNVPIDTHSNPSVKYRRISETVDRITNEQDFLKKMINSDWGRKEFFETHALWHSKIISNIAASLKTLPNNSPLRKQIIHLIGDDVPAAVLARLLEVSEKTVYRSRKLDQVKSLLKSDKDKSLKHDFGIDGNDGIQSIQSVVVSHGEIEGNSDEEVAESTNGSVHDMMRGMQHHHANIEANNFNFPSNFNGHRIIQGLE
eukprot:TRINITY_DN5644_c0_g3_i1.p1 TRINITY_DN5644_c0_g3~~TRINITY_DN5644_c0_g3_i1.p1  ORF type:complete len:335 (+),score=129.66 TRINITY_DN5644_c0_g3_i1:63-1067(+)